MASRNGVSVYDLITSGYRRTVLDLNGQGDAGLTIPSEIVDEYDIRIGDEVAIREKDNDSAVLEVHFK
jgi:bifunctional DNA-binding transcriptional regulator/antitoxin component of YhaV-PrlF toxin-antitoxin module